MKKTLKAFIASILVISMLFCTVSASASSFLPPNFGEDDLVSELDFVPDKTGYHISESKIRSDEEPLHSVSCGSNESLSMLYYLDSDKMYTVEGGSFPQFIDTEIDSISVSDTAVFDNLIIDVDVEEGDTEFYIPYPVDIVFANGETVNTFWTPFICENGISEGENEIRYDIPNYDGESKTVTVLNIDDVIKSVKFRNESKYTTVCVDYKNNIIHENLEEAVVVINGSQEIVANEYGYFVYSSRNYPVIVDMDIPEDAPVKTKVYIKSAVGRVEIASYVCKVVEADPLTNKDRVLYYFEEEVMAIALEIVDRYSSYIPNAILIMFLPVMWAEYFIRAIPLSFEYLSIAIDFVLEAYNFA